jgi:thioredoxin 1
MKIEVLHATGCAKCLRELDSLRALARRVDPAVEWQELDVLAALDYAVELGVLKLPAMAIDGTLAFASLPTPDALSAAIRERRRRAG